MIRRMSSVVKVASVTLISVSLALSGISTASALPSNGSLLVPDDLAPGNYWATPTDPLGGYVEVCADYACDVSLGMIENYSIAGRTMIVVPYHARLVNVSEASLTTADVAPVTAPPPVRYPIPAPVPEGAPGPGSGDPCPTLHATTQDGIGQQMWCNPLMTGDHSLRWMYGGPS